MPTDTKLNNLVINYLTQEQYDAIESPNENELYLTPDNSTGGGASVSPCLNLVDFSGNTPVVRTSITEEEKNNIDNRLYSQVIYIDQSLGQNSINSIYFPEIFSLSVDNIFSIYRVLANESSGIHSIVGLSTYAMDIGEKNTDGTYPITITKMTEATFGGGGGASISPISVESNAEDLPVTITLTDEQSTAIENQIANGHFNVNVTLSATGQKFLFNQAVALAEGGVLYYAMAMISFSLFTATTIVMTYSKSAKTLTLSQQEPLFKNETSLRVIDNKVSLYSGDNDTGAPFGKSYSVAKINGNSILNDPDTIPVQPSYYAPETINTTATPKVLTSKSGAFEWSDLPRYEHTITIKNSEGKILWTQTMRNSSNTIVNSYTNLKTLFGEATYAGFGEYCQLNLEGGTEATDKLIKADGTEATLASLGAIVYTDKCFLPK